ncbi:MAG: 50S ribosome-binding GTPase, partial [Planctomycetes bacterium]|nr:50S ribosome-binding GTPase [Planctomycetota bacterium]
ADRLRDILNSNIRCEQMLDLPAVGIAGLPNAGKSSLLNALLGRERSIVSDRHATTRDVLTGLLDMKNSRCAIFDCAGLTRPSADTSPTDILETLAQQAAIQALKSAEMLLFCIDVSKDDYSEDLAVAKVLKGRQHILVLTKCDLVTEDQLAQKTAQLGEMLTIEPIATSTETGNGIEDLRRVIDEAIVKMTGSLSEYAETIAITERHQRLVREAMENLAESADEINAGNDEVAAMLLRGGYEQLADLETEHIDEAVLERIFSRFCIGK